MPTTKKEISEKTPMIQKNQNLPIAKKMEAIESHFQQAPDEVKLEVFKRCDIKTLGRVARVCKQWGSISEDKKIWHEITLQEYPNVKIDEKLDGKTIKKYLRNTLFLNKKIFSSHQTILNQLEAQKTKKPVAFNQVIFAATGGMSGIAGCGGGAILGALNSQWFCCDMLEGISRIYSACVCGATAGCACATCGFALGAIIATCIWASDGNKEDARCEQAKKIYEEKVALFKEINTEIAKGEIFVKPSTSPVPALQMK